MSAYPPPINNLTVFNSNEFNYSSNNLTISSGDSRYLKLTGGTETGLVTFSSGINISSTTNSTSSTTGSIVTAGGIGITGDTYFNGNLNLSGTNTSIHNRGGSAANPSYSFLTDQTTGLYRVGAGSIGISSAGVQVGSWSTSGLTIGNGTTIGTLKTGTAIYAPGILTPQLASTPLTIPFGITFSSAPLVIATINTATYVNSEAITMTITSISTTGFVITIYNSSTTVSTPSGATYKINWMATL